MPWAPHRKNFDPDVMKAVEDLLQWNAGIKDLYRTKFGQGPAMIINDKSGDPEDVDPKYMLWSLLQNSKDELTARHGRLNLVVQKNGTIKVVYKKRPKPNIERPEELTITPKRGLG